MISRIRAERDDKLARVARRLRSLHDGDLAVIESIGIGTDAIPVLREVLFERDRAGIFEPRVRAVRALGALNATNVLKDFVATWRPAVDPIERLGDEAVLSATARSLGATLDEQALSILCAVAREHPIPGVIETLGRFKRPETIPILIDALADDCAATAAQDALRSNPDQAVPSLIEIALRVTVGPSGREMPSSVRRRRRALRLLLEMPVTGDARNRIARLAHDPDDEIAALACRIAIAADCEQPGRACAKRLVDLLQRAPWPLRKEIEDCLIEHLAVAREFVDRALGQPPGGHLVDSSQLQFRRSLERIKRSGSSARGH